MHLAALNSCRVLILTHSQLPGLLHEILSTLLHQYGVFKIHEKYLFASFTNLLHRALMTRETDYVKHIVHML